MTGWAGSLFEAWDEVRVHRARVVLSLVGVVLAVFAMTVVTAAGFLLRQIVLEQTERFAGRDTTVNISAYPMGDGTDAGAATADPRRLYESLVARYGIEYSSQVRYGQLTTDPLTGQGVQVVAVDADYAVIHRIGTESGRWLADGDGERLLPAVVANEQLVELVGTQDRSPPYQVQVPGSEQTVLVVGTVQRDEWSPALWTDLAGGASLGVGADGGSLEVWVPPDQTDRLVQEVPALARADGLQADVFPATDPTLTTVLTVIQLIILGLSLFALFLGSLGVLNVGVVTVRQRVREIGVRRALGASSSRIFAAVMLESVVATALAGLVGIALAVAVVSNAPLELLPPDLAISDDPPFPWQAAVQAFVAATAVGALAGLVPAVMAVRVKVIDAIRY
ncbi:hypothetical protein GCM10028777_24480 [Angustibacter speluncae]